MINIKLNQKEISHPIGDALLASEDQLEEIEFHCRRGVCGKCVVKVNEGASCINKLTQQEEFTLSLVGYCSKSHRLACQMKVDGDIHLESI